MGGPKTYTYTQIAEIAFQVLDKEPKISRLPQWLNKTIIFLMRIFTSSKIYGPVEFMMTVMTMDVVGETYGSEKLDLFYRENVGN